MSHPRAFISFDFDNNEHHRTLFVGQIKNSRTPFDVQDWSSKSALPQMTWEDTIRRKISQTHLMVVLVGRHMASARGVRLEIEMAQSLNVPFFGVYVDNAGPTSNLPLGLARNRCIGWSWIEIADAIGLMMREGKNR